MNRFAGSVMAIVVACLALLGSTTPAGAHNSLISSTPQAGAVLDAAPTVIELTFDQPIQAGQDLNTIAVIGPDNGRWEAGPAQVTSTVVAAPVRPLGPAGRYRVGYRVLSADGHPVSGEITFTLARPGTGSAAPTDALPGPGPATGTPTADQGIPVWVWLVGAGALLAAGLVLAFRTGGRNLR